ncbi:MAG: hypothetical protein ACI9P5_002012 [Saprospiraceae bacterium]|jgi:hypothetical protein
MEAGIILGIILIFFVVLILVLRLLGAWMLRIDEVITWQKQTVAELTLLRKYYEQEKSLDAQNQKSEIEESNKKKSFKQIFVK